MRILQRTRSVVVCRSVLFAVIAICIGASQARAQWTTTGNDITNSNTGNVGVGKSSPTHKLDILSSIATIARFDTTASASSHVLINSPTGFNSNLTLQKAGLNKWSLANVAADDRFSFLNNTGMLEVLSLTQAGNVGINTPSPQDRLHLYESSGVTTARFQANTVAGFVGVWELGPMLILSNNRHPGTGNNFKTTAAGAQINIGPDTAPGDISFFTTSSGVTASYAETFRVKANGRVGIGTGTPGYQLDVQGGSINSSGGLCIAGDCKTVWPLATQWTTTGSTINYSAGNVGIGVASPGTKLDVNGTVNAAGFTIGGAAFTSSQWATSGPTINYSGGNVGVNTASPTTKLHVTGVGTHGTATFTGTANPSYFNYNADSSEDTYIRGGKTTSRVIINDSASGNVLLGTGGGNVGIGVASPSTKLEVNGTVKATAFNIGGTPITSSQWATSGSTINYASGNVGINNASPAAKLHVTGVGSSGTAAFGGTNNTSHFNNGAAEDTYIRGGKTTSRVVINDSASGIVSIAEGGGNVGVGTASPTSKLHVNGTGRFTGDLTVDGNIAAKYQDVAEWVPAVEAEELSAGTVVVLDQTKSNHVISSNKSYDSRVAGVISAQPGIMLGEKADNKVLVATTGRVLVNVDATNGPIEIGDLLVTSDREGVAMKSQPVEIGGVRIHRPGTLIGKALEPLASGTGKILVLLSLQ
jgi:hypothetical protein